MMRHVVKIRSTFLTLFLGFLGGIIFYILKFPMPWLIGPMVMLALIAFHGKVEINMPSNIRNSMLALLGLMVGSTINPEVITHIPKWWLTFMLLIPLLITQLFVAFVFLKYTLKKEHPATRFFGSAPGGLIEMITLTRENKGDERSVLIMHILRLSALVFITPILFQLSSIPSSQSRQLHDITSGLIQYGFWNMMLLIVCVLAGVYGGRILRLPAATVLGPFVLSSIFYGTDILQADPPFALMILAQMVVGAGLGTRFAGYTLQNMQKLILPTLLLTGIFMLISAGFAFLGQLLTPLPYGTIFLAYMPGGMTQMSIIALTLDLNAGFVMTHLMGRVFMVVILAPICYKIIIKRLEKVRRL